MKNSNKYPDGKIDPTDKGKMSMTCYISDNRVILDFGTEMTWIGFDKVALKSFIEGLQVKLSELK